MGVQFVCFIDSHMSKLESYELLLDSTFTNISNQTGVSSYDTPLFVLPTTLRNIESVKVLEASIPFTFYTIPEGNAPNGPWGGIRFNYATLPFTTSNSALMVIAPGTYTSAQLVTALTAGMASMAGTLTALTTPFTAPVTYTATFNNLTGKFTLEFISAMMVGPPVNTTSWQATNALIAQILGLPLNSNSTVTTNLANGVISGGGTVFTTTFPNIASPAGSPNLYINSRILGPILKVYMPQGPFITGDSNTQIQGVPLSGNYGDVMVWENHLGDWLDMQNTPSIERLDLYITAGFGDIPLKFNGLGFMIKLGLRTRGGDSGYETENGVKRLRIG